MSRIRRTGSGLLDGELGAVLLEAHLQEEIEV